MNKFVITIPFYKDEKALDQCLNSLKKIYEPVNWQSKILIVNNNKKNLGFAGAVNEGIKKAIKNKAEAVLLLNQDTVVDKDFLGPLLSNKADIVAPIIKFKRNNQWVYDYGGRIDWVTGKTSHVEIVNRKQLIVNSKSIDYVSGCCMLIRRPVWEKIGFFDQRFFLYNEDVDYCLRAQKAGFKISVEPKSIIYHNLKEGKKKPLWQRYQLVKSNLLFIHKWLNKPLAYIYWLLVSAKILIG